MIEEINKAGKPYISRYRPDNDYTLSEIRDSYIYFQKRELLNDPFDSTPNLIDTGMINIPDLYKAFEILMGKRNVNKVKTKFNDEQLEKIVRDSIPEFINKHGIACFSMVPGIDMVLLNNYSNGHKGLYLQYNIDYDIDFFNGLKPVKYYQELKRVPFEIFKNEDDIFQVFYQKQMSWSFEKELRLIKENFGSYNVKRTALRNIICGYKCSDDYINKVLEANKKNKHVHVWKMDEPTVQNRMYLNYIG